MINYHSLSLMMQTLFNSSMNAFDSQDYSADDIRYCQKIQGLFMEYEFHNGAIPHCGEDIWYVSNCSTCTLDVSLSGGHLPICEMPLPRINAMKKWM